jgi:hypothetical protein
MRVFLRDHSQKGAAVQIYSTEIGPVHFNPANRVFEALVTLHEGSDIFRIPCSLRFPIEAEPAVVVPALVRQAKEKRRLSRMPLVSRTAA